MAFLATEIPVNRYFEIWIICLFPRAAYVLSASINKLFLVFRLV